jgi:chromosome segregation ATPase
LRQSRAAEQETAERASAREQAHTALVTQLRGQILDLKTQLQSAEEKLGRAGDELKSYSDSLSSLCTMYLYKEDEVAVCGFCCLDT